jgi:hypothetical protein
VEQTVGTTILVAVGTPPPASYLLIGSTAIKITAIGDNDRDCANSQVQRISKEMTHCGVLFVSHGRDCPCGVSSFLSKPR